MRLLVAASSYFPDQPSGAARLAYDLAREFVAQGHAVWFVCQGHKPDISPYIVDRDLHVLRYVLAPGRGLDVFRHVRHTGEIKRLVRQYFAGQPDAIHGHDPLAYIAALDYYRNVRLKTCYTIHSPATEELRIVWNSQGWKGRLKNLLGQPLMRNYEYAILMRSDALAAESEFTRTLIRAEYGDKLGDRVQIVPGWVDTDRFVPLSPQQVVSVRQQLQWPLDRPVFFVLRRLEARMGLDQLLRALAELKQGGFDVFTAIAGSGHERPALEDLQRQLGLEAHVRFVGRISDDLLPAAYGACDASIIPSRALEGFGIIALEAMAAGRPVLVTPIGALPEVVGAFEPAWVAAGNEAPQIAAILRSFLQNQLPAHESHTIARYVLDRYPFRAAFDRYDRLLRE